MGLINAFATLKKYGINAETMENVVEQNSGEAVNVLHNRRGLFALLQQVELLLCTGTENVSLSGGD